MIKRICFTGPSGSGKSTLARYVNKETHIDYFEGSGYSKLLSLEQRAYLSERFGYTGGGHAEVIKLSNLDSEFGTVFQEFILGRRIAFILRNERGLVTDRSPVDNVVYCLLQTAHYTHDVFMESFIEKAKEAYLKLTHLIFIPCTNPSIEDNKSRVDKLHYQKLVSSVFEFVLKEYFLPLKGGPKVLVLDYWDLEKRKKAVMEFINPGQLEIELK